MPETNYPVTILRFGAFELDLRAGELRKQGLKIRLQEKPLQVLTLLLMHPGELVTREEIRQQLWAANTFVDFDHGVNTAIKKLREALGDSAENPRFIETLPRHGYRLIAAVDSVAPTDNWQRFGGPAVEEGRKGTALPESRRDWCFAMLAAGGIAIILMLFIALDFGGVRERLTTSVGKGHGASFPKIKSIAVLPLENLSGDPEQEYFADGMTDELITELSKIGAMRVIARTSVMRYKETKKSLPQVARELNVDAVIEGSVLRSGDRVRINTQLVDASTKRNLWAQTYDRKLGDVLALHSEVARAIARQIRITVTREEQKRLASTHMVNPRAYEAYLKGRTYLERRETKALKKGLQYFREAVKIDSGWAAPYVGIADSYMLLVWYGPMRPGDAFSRAKLSLLRAMEIDPALPEAHISLGEVLFNYDWDWPGAQREVKRALELEPNDGQAHYRYSQFLSMWGRHDEALVEAEKARLLDPLSPIVMTNVGTCLYYARQYGQATEELRTVRELYPSFWVARWYLGAVYFERGLLRQAREEFEAAAEFSNRNPSTVAWLTRISAAAGEKGRALQLLAELKEQSKQKYVSPSAFMEAYVGLRDHDKALMWLEKGYAEHYFVLVFLKVAPFFDPLRSDLRFQSILRRMNFPP